MDEKRKKRKREKMNKRKKEKKERKEGRRKGREMQEQVISYPSASLIRQNILDTYAVKQVS
jgi:hypothetical protein